MPCVLIIHEVAEYAHWKAAFDAAVGLRRDAGELSYQLLAFDDDANKVVHFSEWTSLAAARAFFQSEVVAEVRRRAGVKEPEFCYLERLEAGTL
ncbi:antibiotic biosynthesis monooxygenase [Alteraurantiacibacter buctensis]|uniref:Antibiotic biosynthesis monooxygenase n=1 Tax=Alteraurantiacibacter buctensis TaxID=1503981 RepID=A0A844YW89_9SPHN|nr:antibiotic biosynthesis monooxygenase [Alteraurantiacibacter buctensis]MXO71218.1 antibiotic biosynthesis monooxygenase [Alteraurantiacibacter buctensis]